MLEGVSLLDATMEVEELSKSLITNNVIPRQAAGDVTHIAIAATSGVDYFVTWNFRHIANAAMRTDRGYMSSSGIRSCGNIHSQQTDGRRP